MASQAPTVSVIERHRVYLLKRKESIAEVACIGDEVVHLSQNNNGHWPLVFFLVIFMQNWRQVMDGSANKNGIKRDKGF